MSGLLALNFYSPVFVDQLKRGRKTATIRLGNKSAKYQRSQIVWVTVGSRHSRREKIFSAVIDEVEVKRLSELSPRDIERDNPEFRRVEETRDFLQKIYDRE
ncbi:MAG TPA: ASCH domain-containing protein, partial [Solirubrobacterales bacterium]|nr:ASCH domain-containing protein [Solirubrobacterales bacterium]